METDDVGATLPGVELATLTALLVTQSCASTWRSELGRKRVEETWVAGRVLVVKIGVVLGHVESSTFCVEN